MIYFESSIIHHFHGIADVEISMLIKSRNVAKLGEAVHILEQQ